MISDLDYFDCVESLFYKTWRSEWLTDWLTDWPNPTSRDPSDLKTIEKSNFSWSSQVQFVECRLSRIKNTFVLWLWPDGYPTKKNYFIVEWPIPFNTDCSEWTAAVSSNEFKTLRLNLNIKLYLCLFLTTNFLRVYLN